jgi:molybdopterin converting factor small subunit
VSVQLTIKLFASFQRGRFAVETRAYPESPTVGEVVDELAIPRAEVGVMMVNGRNVEFDDRPAEGGVLAIFPVIGGG